MAHPLPPGFKLTPDLQSTTLPVTPVIPPVVASGDVITSLHENLNVQALTDLWTNEQWLASQSFTDPTTTKGDLLARNATALARLAVGTNGHVLTVDSATAQGIKWAVPSGAVMSVFGRAGVVVAASGDYTAAQVTNAVSVLGSYPDPAWITSLAYSKITGVPAAGVGSVFGRTGAVVAVAGDYTAALVTNAVSTLGSYADPPWITSLAYSKITGVPAGGGTVSSVFGRVGDVVATAGDYTAAKVTNAVSTLGSYADPAWITSLAWSKITGAPGGGGSQTPWTSNINAANFILHSVNSIAVGTGVMNVAPVNIETSGAAAGLRHRDQAANGTPGAVFLNDSNYAAGLVFGGSAAVSVPLRGVLSLYTQNSSGVPICLSPGEVERMRITVAGDVGIGTNLAVLPMTDGNSFHTVINTAASGKFPVLSLMSNAGIGVLAFCNNAKVGTDKRVAQIVMATSGANGDSGSFSFYTYNAGAAVAAIGVEPSGAVGIRMGGSPSYSLSVNGDCNLQGGVYRVNGVPISTGGGGSQTPWTQNIDGGGFTLNNVSQIGVGTTTQFTFQVREGPNLNILLSPIAGVACIQSFNDAISAYMPLEYMASSHYLMGGAVGIGTTTPGTTLDVTGSARINGSSILSGVWPTAFSVACGSAVMTAGNDYPLSNIGLMFAGNQVGLNTRMHVVTTGASWADVALGLSFDVDASIGVGGQLWFKTGNIGIGTSSPQARLHVFGGPATISLNSTAASSAGTSQLAISGQTNSAKCLWMGFDTSVDVGVIQAGVSGISWNSLCLNPAAGNVGINTASPQVACDVRGGLDLNNTLRIWRNGRDNNYSFTTTDGILLQIGYSGTGTSILNLQYDGKVGIGTTAPGAKLTVDAGPDHVLNVRGDPTAFGLPGSLTGPILQAVTSNQAAQTAFTIFGGPIQLQGGNVGIGMGAAVPGYMLDVNGDINSRGVLRVNGVAVPLSSGALTARTNQTAGRQLNVQYNNATGKPMFVSIFIAIGAGQYARLVSDASSGPTSIIDNMTNTYSGTASFSIAGWVMPGHYYKAETSSSTLNNWYEWS